MKFTHSTCGRTFRTARGKRTHVICEPVATATPTPTQPESASAQEQAWEADIRVLKAELADTYIAEGVAPVKAKIRANRIVREALLAQVS